MYSSVARAAYLVFFIPRYDHGGVCRARVESAPLLLPKCWARDVINLDYQPLISTSGLPVNNGGSEESFSAIHRTLLQLFAKMSAMVMPCGQSHHARRRREAKQQNSHIPNQNLTKRAGALAVNVLLGVGELQVHVAVGADETTGVLCVPPLQLDADLLADTID